MALAMTDSEAIQPYTSLTEESGDLATGGSGSPTANPTAGSPTASEEIATGSAVEETDEVLELNVGGDHISTLKSTLVSRGGMLASMFSDAWKLSVPRDSSGNIFLDMDPDCFYAMLQELRLFQRSAEVRWGTKVDQPRNYFLLLDFLGLLPPVECAPFSLDLKICGPDLGSNISCIGSLVHATRASCSRHRSMNGSLQEEVVDCIQVEPMKLRLHTWGFKVWSGYTAFPGPWPYKESDRHKISRPFFGLVVDPTPDDSQDPAVSGSLYGFPSEEFLQVQGASMELLQKGDVMYMQLDPVAGLLRMRAPRFGSHEFELPVPLLASYRIYFKLSYGMDVEVLAVDWYGRPA